MTTYPDGAQPPAVGKRRRWLLAVDPIFEAGRKGKKARAWDAEDELVAVALFGDVTIDISRARSTPSEVSIEAYAIFRDVDVCVPDGTHVELSGRVLRGDLSNQTPAVPEGDRSQVVRVHGHTVIGDVTVRTANPAP
jgi:predicted membrane protein